MEEFKKLVKDVKERFKDNSGILNIIEEMEEDVLSRQDLECLNMFRRLYVEEKDNKRD